MPRQILLQVLEEASVAEVVDVSTEKHQLWVSVIGHTVVGGHGVSNNRGHHEGGGAVADAFSTAFYQGTKSGQKTQHEKLTSKTPLMAQICLKLRTQQKVKMLSCLPTILCQC